MSFASGPVSFQRFFIAGRISKDLTDDTLNALNARAFGRNAALSDESHYGWIGPRHLFETKLTGEHIAFGSFLHLALRIDKLRAPASVVKAFVQEAEEAAKETSGREFLSKGERKKCREVAALRAEQEARGGAFRRMSSYPVLIDLANKRVYLGNTGSAAADVLMKLFSDTFGAALDRATPDALARRILAGTKNPAALDNTTAFRLTKPPEGYERDEDTIQFHTGDLNFLGKELLTWLWCQTDSDDSRLRMANGDDVTVMLDRTLRLKCDYGVTGVDVLTADGVTSLPEAKAALRIGKQPVKAGLVIGASHGEFKLALDALRMNITGLILPEEKSEQDYRTRLEARFELANDAANLIDALYELYLLRRASRDWPAEQRALAAWASGERARLARLTAAGA
jgi:hypothetical protein